MSDTATNPQARSRSERALIWFMLVRQNILSTRARRRLERWLSDPLNRQAFDEVVGTWHATDAKALQRVASLNDDRCATKLRRSAPLVRRRPTAFLLAAVALAYLIGWISTQTSFDDPRAPMTVVTSANQSQQMQLPDGSLVNVAPLTMVTVDVDAHQRHVQLARGEAEFEIAHDPDRPFTVATPAIVAIAVGTRFSVQRHNNVSTVVVHEGIVAVSSREGHGWQPAGLIIKLHAGQKISIPDHRAHLSSPDEAAIGLEFDDVSLGEAVAEFNRANALQIKIDVSETAARRLLGYRRLRRDSPENFLRILDNLPGISLVRGASGEWIVTSKPDHSAPTQPRDGTQQ